MFEAIWSLVIDYIIPFVVVLSIVVFVHEFGHFWVARRCGVKVLTFSIGMGPEIFGRTDKHGTRWRFSALPIGGYVQMFGDADPSSATPGEGAKAMTAEEKKSAFFAQNVYKRLAIIAAGPGANYLFALIVWFVMAVSVGQPYTQPVVDTVIEKGAAAMAGVKPGDKILSVDGEAIHKFSELQRLTLLNIAGAPMKLEIAREGQVIPMTVTPLMTEVTDRFGNESKMPRLGVTAISKVEDYEKLSVGEAVTESFATIWGVTRDTLIVLKQMIVGTRSTEELGGALRIAKLSGDIAQDRDLGTFVWFIVLLSVNLGFINLLPIPLLDGGHIVFYLAEAIRRKPLSERLQEYAARLGFGVVLCIMGFTLWNDLVYLKVLPYLKSLFS